MMLTPQSALRFIRTHDYTVELHHSAIAIDIEYVDAEGNVGVEVFTVNANEDGLYSLKEIRDVLGY
jgi:hypothetical protein